jgi:sec-independent protein translocase protein TatA
MGNIGPMELVIVLVIALMVLGPKRLPEVGKSLGRSMREFKGAVSGDHDDDDDEVVEHPAIVAAQPADVVPAATAAARETEPVREPVA